MRPDDRLVMPRTGSMASKVGPAVIKTFLPANSLGVKKAITSSSISSGSSMRPAPTSPQACSPLAGPSRCTPSVANRAALRCVAGFSHIWRFIAGAIIKGHSRASTMVANRSSAKPCAARAMKSADAGATRIRSAWRDRSICAIAFGIRASHWSMNTGLPDSAWKVVAVTKWVAPSVIATCTSAPCLPSKRTSSAAL